MSSLFSGSHNIADLFDTLIWKWKDRKAHPDRMNFTGITIFCGMQGDGKSLSASKLVRKLTYKYPKAILCTNMQLGYVNPETVVVEYAGLESLKNIENDEYGVIYLIDEIHLELNSLESQNIDIDQMVELSQQRKQRKCIIGTSQVYLRMAKPLREQVRNVIVCRNWMSVLQVNSLIDSHTIDEKNGNVAFSVKKRYWWFHTVKDYLSYDTYAKMRRYKKEWKGRKKVYTIDGWD